MSLKNKIARFLECQLDCNGGQLTVSGIQHNLEPLVFQFLLLLIQNQGEIVSKQNVIDQLWVDKKPTDEALRAMVKKTREALKDDARNPRYIKTIPTKGYVLIPPVELSSTVVKTWVQAHKKLSIALVVFASFSATLLTWYFFIYQPTPQAIDKIVLSKTSVANIANDEVSTYYISGILKNIVIDNDFKRKTGELKIDYIDSKLQQKVVFNTLLSEQFWWSNLSQRLLVMRNDFSGFYMLQFYRSQSDPFITLFEVALAPEEEVLAFDQAGTSVIIQAKTSNSLYLLNLQDNEKYTKPMLNHVETWAKSTQAQLGTVRALDLKLFPANNSEMIMAILSANDKSYFHLYESMDSEQTVYEFTSNQAIISAIWDDNDERFSFTTDDGQLFSFQVDAQRLTSWNSGGESISRIVVDCGADCFVIATTQDLPKLSEISNPFRTSPLNSANEGTSNNEYAQLIQSNSITRNESLPLYTEQGLYFVNQSSSNVAIIFKANNDQEELIYSFDSQVFIDELVLDKTENILVGRVNQRPFLLDLNTRELRYLMLNLPLVSHFNFNDNNDLLYYGKTIDAENLSRGEKLNLTPDQAGRRTAGLFEYNLKSRQSRLLLANMKVQQFIDLSNTIDGQQVIQKARFQIDSAQYARVIFRNDKAPLEVGLLVNDCISCWEIKGNFLYILDYPSDKETVIRRINLLNGEEEQAPILVDSVLKHFALHPSNYKIMLSTRQNLQTELTQIEGLQQIF